MSVRQVISDLLPEKVSWADAASVLVSVAALVFSTFALSQSIRGNDMARAALNLSEEAFAQQNTPRLEPRYFISSHPEMLSDEDLARIEPTHLIPRIMPTRYWRSELQNYPREEHTWYIFLVIVNRGPGRAISLNIEGYNWYPMRPEYLLSIDQASIIESVNSQVPDGFVELEAPLGDLLPGEYYSLLVDVLHSSNRANVLSLSKSHFLALELWLQYQDLLANSYTLHIPFGALPCFNCLPFTLTPLVLPLEDWKE